MKLFAIAFLALGSYVTAAQNNFPGHATHFMTEAELDLMADQEKSIEALSLDQASFKSDIQYNAINEGSSAQQ